MAKTAYINVRVDEEVKLKAEEILNELGINTSTAIDMFLSQIILKEGLPFDVRIPKIDYDKATQDLLSIKGVTDQVANKKWFKKILSLYAQNEISYEVAVFAIRSNLN